MEAAPYFADVAARDARAVWARASDGARLRVALWPEARARGTVVMFPGRTEYCEKYSDAAREFGARGWAAAAVDWRGQGLADRTGQARHVGHVDDFADFQRDVAAYLAVLEAEGFPKPFHLLAHSMGGLIGLRALVDHPVFARAAFSAPMWGLPLAPGRRMTAFLLSRAGRTLGYGRHEVPASGAQRDPVGQPFEGNLLTSDPAMFAWMKAQLAAHPDLALGGPSLGWLWAALGEMRDRAARPAPDVPCLTLLGTEEGIVDAGAIMDRLDGWEGADLRLYDGARHEVLMEAPETRRAAFDAMDAHFGAG